uniref:Ion_trans_2 domain-containing protein n=2 Tax=Brugia TaxID=6278 RepID=A0A158PS28_BRUPA
LQQNDSSTDTYSEFEGCVLKFILLGVSRGTDYGAMIIKGSAGIVITVSLGLIFLVIGNMVYQTFTRKVVLCEKVSYLQIFDSYIMANFILCLI